MSEIIKRPIGTWKVAEVDTEHNECETTKSMYDEALEIIDRKTFELGKGLDVLGANDRTKIEQALSQAQSQEKLLKLYQKLVNDWNELSYEDVCYIEKRIHELESNTIYDESLDISKPNFKVGEVVIYQNGDRFELGIIKTVERHSETSYKYRVWYHTGETTAMTDEHLLKKISNLYAFKIKRYDTEGKVIDE